MSRLSFEPADFSQSWAFQSAELAQATNLSDLCRRCATAIAAVVPGSRFTVTWNEADLPLPPGDQAVPAIPPPTPTDRSQLQVGLPLVPRQGNPGYVPLRSGGELRGWFGLVSPEWNAEQTHALTALAGMMAAMLTLLERRTEGTGTEKRRFLAETVHTLRGVLQFEVLMEQLATITTQLLDTPNFFAALTNSHDQWLEMVYLVERGQRRANRPFWRQDAGLSGIVVATRAPICTDDYMSECERRKIPALMVEGTMYPYAWLGVPLLVQDQVIGALVSFQTEPGITFTETQVVLLHELAAEAAIAIQNAHLFARAERQARQLTALNRIIHSMTSTLDPERVPSLIMQQAQELLDVEEGSLLLVDEASGDLVFSYACGPTGNELLGQRLPHGVGVAGFVATSGQSALVNDTSSDGRFYAATDTTTGYVTRSLLAVPLRGLGGIMGVIEVMNKRSGAPFVAEDRMLLEAFADQSVIALENAQRFAQVDQALARRARELDRSNDQLREILRVGNALRAERRLDELLRQIAEAASQNTGFRSAVIVLVERERTVQPYLRRVVAAGPAAAAFDRMSMARVPLERLQALLRPEFQRGTVTYLIDHHHDDYFQLWGTLDQTYIPDLPPPAPGGWHARDTLFSLLRDRRGEILGLLRVEEPNDGKQPSSEQVQILEIFANQAAVAIENARLYSEQQHNLRSMIALNGLGMAINTTLRSAEQIFQMTTSGMIETTAAQSALVLLREEDQPAPGTASHPAPLRPVVRLGAMFGNDAMLIDLARQAMSNGRPMTTRHLPTSTTESSEAPVVTWVAIPLRATQHTLGAICVAYAEGVPSTTDLETLALFASQAAVAVESVRLFSEVRRGRDQLASIMASTHEGMLLITDTGQIAVVNSAFHHLVGMEEGQVVNLALDDFLAAWESRAGYAPDEWHILRAGLLNVRSGVTELGQGQLNQPNALTPALEWTALRVTGEAGTVAPPAEPATNSGNASSLLLVLRDITTAKEAERLRQDLTSMIVHDLRSPLTSIMTSIDMIFKGIIGEVNPRQSEVLAIAFESAEHLLSMVNLMLDISRLEGGRMPLDRRPLLLDQVVQRAIERLAPIARNKQIQIEVDLPPHLSPVYADSDLSLRVMQNLLDNALKFSPRGGCITIQAVGPETPPDPNEEALMVSASNDSTATLYPGRMVTIAVRDYGPGIAQADQEKIFAKFGQAGKWRRDGTGLGLTFCKLAVEAHGGRIWVESELGEGSTFAFNLPTVVVTMNGNRENDED